MLTENIEISLTLPRALWEQLHHQAQTTHADEATLLIHVLEQFLQQAAEKQALVERFQLECDELAKIEFDDVGTEDEWLIVQNEALHLVEAEME